VEPESALTQAPHDLEIDLMDGAFYSGDPFPAFEWMRGHAPVFHDERNDLWALSRYDDVRSAGTDPQVFSSGNGIRPKFPPLPMMIDMDDPEHSRRRRLVSAGFTPRRVREMEGHIRAICDQVIDEVCEIGEADFVRDIAAPLPLNVIGDMLGIAPEDRSRLLQWSDDMLRSQDSSDLVALNAAATAFEEYASYMTRVLEARRSTGGDTDLVGILVHAEIDGERLDQDSLIHETLLILIGGDETTRHVLSGGMLALQEHPDQLRRLQHDPRQLPLAVEEMLRWVTPIQNMVRTTTRDVEIRGQRIPLGSEVLLLYPSANRDPSIFTLPDRFDTTRNPNPHLAFGFGTHFCLGNQLARLELRAMFERLFERLPDIRLATPDPPPRRPSTLIRGLASMPVTFTPTARGVT
jgi:cholest-4-en-3-one 26-monooxygenase